MAQSHCSQACKVKKPWLRRRPFLNLHFSWAHGGLKRWASSLRRSRQWKRPVSVVRMSSLQCSDAIKRNTHFQSKTSKPYRNFWKRLQIETHYHQSTKSGRISGEGNERGADTLECERDARRKMVIFAFVLSACSRRTKRLESARTRPHHKISMERFSSDYQSRTLARPNIAAFRRWGCTICLDAWRDACHEEGARGAGGWPDRSDDDDYRAADSTEESNRDERRERGEEQGRSKKQKGCG